MQNNLNRHLGKNDFLYNYELHAVIQIGAPEAEGFID